MHIIDRTDDRGPLKSVDVYARRMLIVHRCSAGENVAEIAEFFRSNPEASKATGGRMPYHFAIGRGGRVEQAHRILDISPHAAKFNLEGIGVAVVGDFRFDKPTPAQWTSLVDLCHVLRAHLYGPRAIHGHTSLDGASRDADKVCPGPGLDFDALRREAEEMAQRELWEHGIRA